MEGNTQEVIEEKELNKNGILTTKKYLKKSLLIEGKNNYYEVINSENNEKYACKIIPKKSLQTEMQKTKLINEMKIHRSMKHPNIISLKHYFEDSENVYLLYEFFKNGTLDGLLRRRKRLSELEVQFYINQLVEALKYLHEKKYIHRNLKLSKCLLSDKLELKLTGFNFTTRLISDDERKYDFCGTPNYIAPEILDNKIGQSYEVDIWALGIMIYTLIIGEAPFQSKDVKITYEKISKIEYSFPEDSIISKEAQNLISKILVLEPKQRPSLEQIQNHNFFKRGTIPKLLPISTLTTPPSLSFIKQFIPNTDEFNIVNRHKEELKEPAIYIVKWLDYSTKYGTGYILSNGFCGVYFNDSTKIIMNPNSSTFYYKEKSIIDNTKEIIEFHQMNNYPDVLKKKVTLLKHFKNYLLKDNENIIKTNKINENNNQNEPYTHVIKWMKTEQATIFRLSNKILHFFFLDKTEIIIVILSKIVIYVNKNKERYLCQTKNALDSDDPDFIKKIKYSKEVLLKLLDKNKNKENIQQKNFINDTDLYKKSKKLTTFNPSENVKEEEKMNIQFNSVNQTIINLSIICQKKDNFKIVKNILFKEYPELKNNKIFFLVNGGIVDEIKTLEENRIKNNTIIVIAEQESFYI